MTTRTLTIFAALTAALIAGSTYAQHVPVHFGFSAKDGATTVYDSTDTYLNKVFTSAVEFGDDVTLAGGATHLTEFSFDFYTKNIGASASGTLRIYSVGADNLPDTLIGDQSFTMSNINDYQTTTITGLDLTVPSTFIWTVEWSGIANGGAASLLMYGDVGVGSSADSFVRRAGAGWELVSIPEPTTMQLGLLAAGAWFGIAGMRRSRKA